MRRWLLWTVVCRRGRRCANLVVDDFKSDGVPPGSILRLGYECGGCGTVYEAVLLVGEDDALVSAGRERLTAKQILARHRQGGGVEIGGGETATFFGSARNDNGEDDD